jgi:acyl carrier protein
MITDLHRQLPEIEHRVCDLASEELGVTREQAVPGASLTEDLGVDSLDLIEFVIRLEEVFGVTFPDKAPNPVYKTVFTRRPFRLSDLAEIVYLQQGTGTPVRSRLLGRITAPVDGPSLPFTHLNGRWNNQTADKQPLLERLTIEGSGAQYRRRSDGMRCILIPSEAVEIGCDSADASHDERPKHVVELDSFLIDAEPVSTTAYCRFLNSIGQFSPEVLADWFVLDPEDDRNDHMLVNFTAGEWRPLPGTDRWPMILVSWYGANAYSLWANGKEWKDYRDEAVEGCGSLLPTEAQWEYAARGARHQPFPWGDALPSQERMRYGQHRRSATYRADALPMAEVNEPLGLSPFGLHHMAGNVWQWCRDWYDAAFYARPEAAQANPVNRTPTQVRSERGGSWVGPAKLCRSSFRRGRPPLVRGRCLGFRCIGCMKDVLD